MMVSKFKVPEFKQLTPEQLEENKKRLEEMIESWKKEPEIAKQIIC